MSSMFIHAIPANLQSIDKLLHVIALLKRQVSTVDVIKVSSLFISKYGGRERESE